MLRTSTPRLLVAAAALMLAACSGGTAAPSPQGDRARLLGALPSDAAARGVYLVELDEAGELSPGSRIAPLVAPLADQAEWLVETGGEPLTLLGGVPENVPTPESGTRAGDVLVIGDAAAREAVVQRLEDDTAPEGLLAVLATTDAPVAWGGPTPAPDGRGTTVVTLAEDVVRFAAEADDLAAAKGYAEEQLATGGPVGSPGKRWASVLRNAEVTIEDNRLVVTGTPADLPGLFLRVLIDQRQVTFLQT